MTTTTVLPPAGKRVRRERVNRRMLAVAGIGVVVAGLVVANHLRDARERALALEPLRAAEVTAQATGQTIATVPTGLAGRWGDTEGPSRTVAQQYLGSGNDLLEPAFYALYTLHGDAAPTTPSDWDCVYFAVEPGGSPFEATRVSDVVQFCYLAGMKAPIESADTGLPG